MSGRQQPGFPWVSLAVAVTSFSMICLGVASRAHGAEQQQWRGLMRICVAYGDGTGECRGFAAPQVFPHRDGCESFMAMNAKQLIAKAEESKLSVRIATVCVPVDVNGAPLKDEPRI